MCVDTMLHVASNRRHRKEYHPTLLMPAYAKYRRTGPPFPNPKPRHEPSPYVGKQTNHLPVSNKLSGEMH
jgi:hypothetical protein